MFCSTAAPPATSQQMQCPCNINTQCSNKHCCCRHQLCQHQHCNPRLAPSPNQPGEVALAQMNHIQPAASESVANLFEGQRKSSTPQHHKSAALNAWPLLTHTSSVVSQPFRHGHARRQTKLQHTTMAGARHHKPEPSLIHTAHHASQCHASHNKRGPKSRRCASRNK
jgi:hypothetical protein